MPVLLLAIIADLVLIVGLIVTIMGIVVVLELAENNRLPIFTKIIVDELHGRP